VLDWQTLTKRPLSADAEVGDYWFTGHWADLPSEPGQSVKSRGTHGAAKVLIVAAATIQRPSFPGRSEYAKRGRPACQLDIEGEQPAKPREHRATCVVGGASGNVAHHQYTVLSVTVGM